LLKEKETLAGHVSRLIADIFEIEIKFVPREKHLNG
jgi:hypothetical protein